MFFVLVACNGGNPIKPGLFDGQLAPCPSSPNCVSSDADNSDHKVAPIRFNIPPEAAWELLIDQVNRMPRTTIVEQTPRYLHVTCRSQVFGFVDDLTFHLRPEQGVIALRSAARTGYYDFGVNRKRVETLRKTLQQKGLVK
ncbi:MAG: DUF1499 domain-containing protein [Desulfuromonadales bacterium]